MEHKKCYDVDFYDCVNSDWTKEKISIPNEFTKWNTFNKILFENFNILQDIIKNNKTISQVNKLYINKNDNGLKLLYKYIKKINDKNNKKMLFNFMFKLYLKYNIDFVLNIFIHNKPRNTDTLIPYIEHNDDLLKSSSSKDKERFMSLVNTVSDLTKIKMNPDNIYYICNILKRINNLNSDEKIINYMDLIKTFDNLDFISIFFIKYNKNINDVYITNYDYIKDLNKLISFIDISVWKEYFIFNFISKFYFCFSKEIELTYYKYYKEIYFGSMQYVSYIRKNAIIINLFNQYIEELYINKFNNIMTEIKTKIIYIFDMIKNIFTSYINDEKNKLSITTKEKIISRLDNIKLLIGYPDKRIINIPTININKSFFYNTRKCIKSNMYNRFDNYKYQNNNIWGDYIYNPNGYYSLYTNTIIIPLGVLCEPLYFHYDKDFIFNFSAIGIILGHELIHAYDISVTKIPNYTFLYDSDKIKYLEQIKKLKIQFLDDDNAIGEIMADIIGISMSLTAMVIYLKKNKVEDMKPHYRNFFIKYSLIWKNITIDDLPKESNEKKDVHLSFKPRVNKILANIDEFYDAFDITSSYKYYIPPNDRYRMF